MIELAGLQKVVDGNLVIDVEALAVRPGEIAAVVGSAGSGREQLLEILLGQSRPTVGTVRVAGLDPAADRRPFSRRVGVLFSDDTLYTRQSSLANLLFHCRLHGLPKSRAAEMLSLVGLADHANVKADKLPSGLVRRLAFARAILHQPEVLLLAEPLARCDEASIALLSRLIHQLADDGGTQLILADSTAHLTSLCDAIHVLDHGRMVESYAPHEEQRAQMPFKIPVKLVGRVALVNPADIRYVVAERSRAFLETAGGRLPTQFTLAELEKRLARSGFFRAHRGYLVNLQHVKEIIPYTRNSFSLLLDDDDGTEIPLSKSAARELRELLGY